MARTLREIVDDDVQAVFLNTREFAREIEYYPQGEVVSKRMITAVVIDDDLQGSREVHGDGIVLNNEAGVRYRESMTIEVPDDLEITCEKMHGQASVDAFVIDGITWIPKRVLGGGHDDAMQSVLVVKPDVKTYRKGVMRG